MELFNFSEEYEETENLRFYRAFTDRNEFTHKSTRCDTYPVIRFYPRTANGEKKTKWVNYRESSINGKVRKGV